MSCLFQVYTWQQDQIVLHCCLRSKIAGHQFPVRHWHDGSMNLQTQIRRFCFKIIVIQKFKYKWVSICLWTRVDTRLKQKIFAILNVRLIQQKIHAIIVNRTVDNNLFWLNLHVGMKNEVSSVVSNSEVVLGEFRFGSVEGHLITS